MSFVLFSTVIICVAPYTGAWIEISNSWVIIDNEFVAPYTGAWIEIVSLMHCLTLTFVLFALICKMLHREELSSYYLQSQNFC